MKFHIPLIMRGRIIDDPDIEFGARHGQVKFMAPDVKKHLAELCLDKPSALADLYSISFEEILDYLEELKERLRFDANPYLNEAVEFSKVTSGLGENIIRRLYRELYRGCDRSQVQQMVENAIGVEYLDNWVQKKTSNGCIASVRAFGARAVHIMAGNVPLVPLMTIIRNAVTRSDAILKMPSNDPITAVAIARTMVDMAPNHPITKHLSVAYWKGGDQGVEDTLYLPQNVEKIIAWGGFASVTHVKKYIQPGIDLITMDPKLSSSIIGAQAFKDEAAMQSTAERLAVDIGYYNQQACANARVAYIETGTDAAGLIKANRFGKLLFDALQALPSDASGTATEMDSQLVEEIQAIKLFDDHKTYGGGSEGGVIVSQTSEPVDFANLLANRVTNLVPVDDLETPIRSVNAYTQTVGVYPDALKAKLRNQLVFQGVQRIVSVGYHLRSAQVGPHDGMEPVRRMCKWITDETSDPELVPLPHLA